MHLCLRTLFFFGGEEVGIGYLAGVVKELTIWPLYFVLFSCHKRSNTLKERVETDDRLLYSKFPQDNIKNTL